MGKGPQPPPDPPAGFGDNMGITPGPPSYPQGCPQGGRRLGVAPVVAIR